MTVPPVGHGDLASVPTASSRGVEGLYGKRTCEMRIGSRLVFIPHRILQEFLPQNAKPQSMAYSCDAVLRTIESPSKSQWITMLPV